MILIYKHMQLKFYKKAKSPKDIQTFANDKYYNQIPKSQNYICGFD